LIDLGITPDSMIGHSLGEYVADCIAGGFTREDALHVIEARGRLMQSMRPGSRMAVYLSRGPLLPWPVAATGNGLACKNREHFVHELGRMCAAVTWALGGGGGGGG
ncbi:acyltransferase domain-containing protein, partial [Escherichia coli]|uniref:acyltransferase domain-containing protein n=1 Tax=Escherichia coli TaxID=562 RepID=UPI00207B8B0F